MPVSLRDFLKQEARKQAVQAEANKGVVEEWQKAIEHLFAQIRSWLADSDPDGIIKVEESKHELTEEGLGHYRSSRLDLHVLGKWIGIIPKARKTVAAARPPQGGRTERATGRVDITDEVRRFVLYRFAQGGGDVWMIDDLRSDPRLLDQQSFEEALLSYLR